MEPLAVIIWACVFAFIITAALTLLDVSGWYRFPNPEHGKVLFKALIVQLVIISVGAFGAYLNDPQFFNPVDSEEEKLAKEAAKVEKERLEQTSGFLSRWSPDDGGVGLSYEDAERRCRHIGKGWRLPNLYELEKLWGTEGRRHWHDFASKPKMSNSQQWAIGNQAYVFEKDRVFRNLYAPGDHPRALCIRME